MGAVREAGDTPAWIPRLISRAGQDDGRQRPPHRPDCARASAPPPRPSVRRVIETGGCSGTVRAVPPGGRRCSAPPPAIELSRAACSAAALSASARFSTTNSRWRSSMGQKALRPGAEHSAVRGRARSAGGGGRARPSQRQVVSGRSAAARGRSAGPAPSSPRSLWTSSTRTTPLSCRQRSSTSSTSVTASASPPAEPGQPVRISAGARSIASSSGCDSAADREDEHGPRRALRQRGMPLRRPVGRLAR